MSDNKSIFVIDDDAIFVFVLKKLFLKMENNTPLETFSNGYLAIEVLKEKFSKNEKLPDIIFLDINMPMLDGWQFLDEVELLPFGDSLNVYVTSSTIDTTEIEKVSLYKTVREFVSKPISLAELNRIIMN